MPMIACPGCGLPRADDQVGVVPCPVCAATSAVPVESAPLPIAAEIPADPIAGLPADVSQMEAHAARAAGKARSWPGVTVAFLLGIAAGVGGLLAAQHVMSWGPPEDAPRVAPIIADGGRARPVPSGVTAPMPREHRATANASRSSPQPKPEPAQKARARAKPTPAPPVVAHVEPVHLNQPDAVYTLPPLERRGEHVVLRGKVRMLRVNGLSAGAVLDASGLEAGSIYVCGTIEERAHLKLNCPDGVVEVPAAVGGGSRVEIDAPGSSVRFVYPTTADRPGSLIDGGAAVAITARIVDLRGDVAGAGTRVKVTLTRNGSLKAAGVRGSAVIEYRTENPQDREPPASAAVVDPTATFRKVGG